MAMGSVMVMPMPTAEPLMAARTGLRQAWIAVVTVPPLRKRGRFDCQCNYFRGFYFNFLMGLKG
jgi:hypothetical protein